MRARACSRRVTPTPTATLCPISFSDVQTADWFYEYVRYLYCRGAISGYGDGTFKPFKEPFFNYALFFCINILVWSETFHFHPSSRFCEPSTLISFHSSFLRFLRNRFSRKGAKTQRKERVQNFAP